MPDPRLVAEVAVTAGEAAARTTAGQAALEAGSRLCGQALHLLGGVAADGGEAKVATSLPEPTARALYSDHSLFVHGGRDPRAWRAGAKFFDMSRVPGKMLDSLNSGAGGDVHAAVSLPELSAKPAASGVEQAMQPLSARVPRVAEPSPIMKALQPLPLRNTTEEALAGKAGKAGQPGQPSNTFSQVFRNVFDRSSEILAQPGGQAGFVHLTEENGHLTAELVDGPMAGAKALWKKGEDTMLVESPAGELHELGRTIPARQYRVDSNLNVVTNDSP